MKKLIYSKIEKEGEKLFFVDISHKMHFYCDCCKESGTPEIVDVTDYDKTGTRQQKVSDLGYVFGIKTIFCPACGHEYSCNNVITRHYYSIKDLKAQTYDNSVTIYFDDNGKITINNYGTSCFIVPKKDGKLAKITELVYQIHKMDLNTGATYDLGVTRYNNGKAVTHGQHIKNVCYGNGLAPLYLPEDAEKTIIDTMAEYKNTPWIKEYIGKFRNLRDLVLLNRLPQIALNIVENNAEPYNFSAIFKGVKPQDPNKTMWKKVFHNMGIEGSAGLSKKLLKNPCLMQDALFVSKVGVKNIDYINSCLDTNNHVWFNPKHGKAHKTLLKAKGEHFVYKAIVNDVYLLNDVYEMMMVYIDHSVDLVPYLQGNVREIHDSLAEDLAKVKRKSVKIPYKESELELQTEYVRLATETKQLVEIGQEMSICVGSYDQKALTKKCLIFYCKDSDDSYRACIEVDYDGKIHQIKGNYNSVILDDEVIAHVKEWVKASGLKFTDSGKADYARNCQ